jgi:hypothetical protein
MQMGGSNFTGVTINSVFNISIVPEKNFSIRPYFGIGIVIPGLVEPMAIIHGGLDYQIGRWGFGTEVSGFTINPFLPNQRRQDFVDMLIFPNLNYTISTQYALYFKFSAGSYLAYSKNFTANGEPSNFRFEGDIIPGAGITIGYALGK